ncbi:sigma-70 family RNA polymerase sigma factor [Fusobacterium polymorphum]|uniref:RNA polymerase subunit sigma n=1 Tax=Fusobacterium nucleatum subsp. polymorphum TaxID=76857 RepID=A0A2C6BW41_FUSNP|nr:sigma-70 family RNA polymerase sigma factor [Fusobacterium polymorphum]PHI08354.1 RNA polymerase subunit sigma [Fusobacterium polymorphum]
MESQEVLELIREAKKGNNETTEKLIERYLNTVRKINNKWGGTDDGFQEGILGIYQAIKTFDESYNTKFMTHLYFHIEAKIRKFIDKERYRVPQYVIESIKKGEQERLYFSGIENLEIEDENTGNENLENKVLVEKLLNCCTRQEKEVLNLLFFEGYSGQAVAEKLRMSRQWVHSIKHRAFEKIRNNIKSPRDF